MVKAELGRDACDRIRVAARAVAQVASDPVVRE
jgi:hypothetical protein